MATDTVESRTCKTCPFYAALNRECRANPPKAFPIPTGPNNIQTFGLFPATREENWCGKHPARQSTLVL